MTECRCHTPPLDHRDFVSVPIGIDETNGRFGEVSIRTCRQCSARWLHYAVEYEGFTRSARWFRGLLTPELQQRVTAANAVAVLAGLPWYLFGGSYFESTGSTGSGPPRVDL